jgi:hypothetical protein
MRPALTSPIRWTRSPTGGFGTGPEGEPFRWLGGILWYRLWQVAADFRRAYQLYLNPNALTAIPREVVDTLEGTINSWKTNDPFTAVS